MGPQCQGSVIEVILEQRVAELVDRAGLAEYPTTGSIIEEGCGSPGGTA